MQTKLIVRLARMGSGLAGMLLLATVARAGDVYVIAHTSVELTQAEIKDVYLGEKQFAGSLKLVPVDNATVQSDFLEKALNLEASKYGALWTKKGFRAGLTAPAVKSSDAEVISVVKSTPGAVGYVGSPAQGVKLLHKY